MSQVPVAGAPILIFQELFSINWLFVLCQTMQIYYTPAVFCRGKTVFTTSIVLQHLPIEVWYDVLIKKLTGAVHNLLSSLTRSAQGGTMSSVPDRGVAERLARGDPDGSAQMCSRFCALRSFQRRSASKTARIL